MSKASVYDRSMDIYRDAIARCARAYIEKHGAEKFSQMMNSLCHLRDIEFGQRYDPVKTDLMATIAHDMIPSVPKRAVWYFLHNLWYISLQANIKLEAKNEKAI